MIIDKDDNGNFEGCTKCKHLIDKGSEMFGSLEYCMHENPPDNFGEILDGKEYCHKFERDHFWINYKKI